MEVSRRSMSNVEEEKKGYAELKLKYTALKEKKKLLESKKEMIESKLSEGKVVFKKSSPAKDDIDIKSNGMAAEKTLFSNREAKPKSKGRKYKDVCKKLNSKTERLNKAVNKLLAKKARIESSEQEVSESKLLWDVLKSQVSQLDSQLNSEIFGVYKEAGNRLKKESNLSIEMYNF
eukprot:TRINITY_DN3515_c0_g1_i1.p2 TRINITY_DN3515_c0_g1~~TRINITY_DN3515_c0_g1_i1.p2  ORF type:complete len:176 (-),score=56.19 TRINITY_DN3515_c0_g1_i1:117-644(-)